MKICEKEIEEAQDGGSNHSSRRHRFCRLRFRSRRIRSLTDSDQKVKAHRTFLEVVLNDAQVPSTRGRPREEGGARGKTRSHDQYGKHPRDDGVTQIVVFGVGPSDKKNEITAEQCEVGKEIGLDCSRRKKAIRTGGKHLQSHGSLDNSGERQSKRKMKAADAIKLELVQHQTMDDSMGVSSMDDLERKELSILRELAAAAMASGSLYQ